MVQNSEWGPVLWRVLHTLAERVGRQVIPVLKTDEVRLWMRLLQHTEAIMPCSICRAHYGDWKKGHPLAIVSQDYGLLQERSRKWLWDLHNHVNTQKGVEGEVIPLEQLSSIYGTRAAADLQKDIDILTEVFKRSMLEGLILGHFVRAWKYDLTLLRKLVNF